MHPSLNAEFCLPPSLTPKVVMGRNERCWCGSGKKWKNCHRNRHLQQEAHYGKLLNDMRQQDKRGTCLHPEASRNNCSNRIIRAHTIQRAGGLIAIAEDGHVISIKKGVEKIDKNEGEILPEPIGIGSASTFMGFCSVHDNSLFEPIENNSFSLNHEAAFLLAFRALSYEYLTKQKSIKCVEIQRNIDKGKDFSTQIQIQNHLHAYLAGLLRGMHDLEKWKSEYDQKFIEKDYVSVPHYAVKFKGILPLVCSGGFHPEVDFDGNQLQIITHGDVDFEHVCINISTIGDNSFLAFGWNGIENGPAEQFVKSFKTIKNSEKANATLILAVEQLENTYFRPSWWNGLSYTNKRYLVSRITSGVASKAIRPEGIYRDLLKILPEIEIENEIGSI